MQTHLTPDKMTIESINTILERRAFDKLVNDASEIFDPVSHNKFFRDVFGGLMVKLPDGSEVTMMSIFQVQSTIGTRDKLLKEHFLAEYTKIEIDKFINTVERLITNEVVTLNLHDDAAVSVIKEIKNSNIIKDALPAMQDAVALTRNQLTKKSEDL